MLPSSQQPYYQRNSNDIITSYQGVDARLAEASFLLRTIEWLTPTNIAEVREAFLSDPTLEPNFSYHTRPPSITEELLSLLELDIPTTEPALSNLFNERKTELLLENALIEARGDREEMVRLSSALYGVPSQELVVTAEAILTETEIPQPFTLAAHEVFEVFEKALEQLGILDWKVSYWRNRTTMVRQETKEILLSQDRVFRATDAKRLAVHEIGVHVTRAANGYLQPFTIFALGLPGYLGTEEGLASYAEQLSGFADVSTLRTYAGRVLAVDALVKGGSFAETARSLQDRGISQEEAFDITARAFRGGGFTKDYLYLDGLTKVRTFVEKGGDVQELMIGKISLEHLPLVSTLIGDGILLPPHYPGYPSLIL